MKIIIFSILLLFTAANCDEKYKCICNYYLQANTIMPIIPLTTMDSYDYGLMTADECCEAITEKCIYRSIVWSNKTSLRDDETLSNLDTACKTKEDNVVDERTYIRIFSSSSACFGNKNTDITISDTNRKICCKNDVFDRSNNNCWY